MQKPHLAAKKKAADAAYRAANKESVRAGILAWSARNPEKTKAYAVATRLKNAEKRKEAYRLYCLKYPDRKKMSTSEWKKRNKHLVAAAQQKRHAAELKRTPAWLTPDDHWMMQQAYELAALRTKMFGFVWHVDHTTPLQGKIVSGLHVPLNLQVIPGVENMRKLNKFEVM